MRVRKIKVYYMESTTTEIQLNNFINEKMEEYENSGNYVVLDVCITSVNTPANEELGIKEYQSLIVGFKLG